MATRPYICLFDLNAYDHRVAPALRMYARQYEPKGIVALLRDALHSKTAGAEDTEHWIDAIGPDAGHKPSDQTVHELSDMLIRQVCLPRPPVLLDKFIPWLSDRSEWFADLMDGGEELAGGSLEFSLGEGRLVATRQQIAQFREETRSAGAPPPELAVDFRKLREVLDLANSTPAYTLLKTSWPS